jgi:hypothetical protein
MVKEKIGGAVCQCTSLPSQLNEVGLVKAHNHSLTKWKLPLSPTFPWPFGAEFLSGFRTISIGCASGNRKVNQWTVEAAMERR